MEKIVKMNFVKDGVLRLPPGFRFHPSDEELIVQYLKRKVFSQPLPASVIPEFDVSNSDPWDLPGDIEQQEQERYFFSRKQVKYPNGNRAKRATCSGYWKATGIDKKIVTPTPKYDHQHQVVVGMKKSLVFYRGKSPKGCKTDWIMHEYRLTLTSVESIATNWVLCRIFLKKRNTKSSKQVATSLYDFMAKGNQGKGGRTDLNLAPGSPSSDLSGITEVSGNQSDDHEDEDEDGSSCKGFITCRKE